MLLFAHGKTPMATQISKQVKQLEERISRIKSALDQLGPMRPGTISLQYRNPQERKTPYYQISYTHQMKSRTEYLGRRISKQSGWRWRISSACANWLTGGPIRR